MCIRDSHRIKALGRDVHVIAEQPYSRKKFIKNRIKKLGYFEVIGQIAFQLLCVPILTWQARARKAELLAAAKLSDAPIPDMDRTEVTSVNAASTREMIASINPDVILVNATRIISRKVLAAFDVPFINTHAGITPMYRGVHGGYWALAMDDRENCGVTVHLVDAGVDTGGILYQKTIEPSHQDNFTTYPLLQQIEGLKLMERAIQDALAGHLTFQQTSGLSKQWYHPTLWGYLGRRWRKGIK